MMSREFYVESYLSTKELNNQSVSLVIPRLTRDRIHNVIYYKANLHTVALRGDTMKQLCKVIIRDLGTLQSTSINRKNVLGGVEFKCILMKLVEIRPTWEQLALLLRNPHPSYNNKYVIALVLTYLRVQYFYLKNDDILAQNIKGAFKEYICDYRKMKSVSLEMDCWSASQNVTVEIIHMDELVDWLTTKDEIWGIPLGRCQWCSSLDLDVDSSDSDEESSDSD